MSLTGAPRFHWLEVAAVQPETADAVSVVFAVPEALRAAYGFRAGQYLTLRATIEGVEVRRSYSICSGEADPELRIAIKRVEGGVFSAWAQAALRPGVAVEVMTPTGRFGVAERPGDGVAVHVGVAAGSGITPVLSMVRTVLARGRDERFFLFYGSRATPEILFRGALEDLKDRYLGRLSVFHVLSQERQDVDVLNGRLDGEKLPLLLRRVLGGVGVDAAYLCGPEGMIEAAAGALAGAGVPAERVHVERFTSALGGRPQGGRSQGERAGTWRRRRLRRRRWCWMGRGRTVPVAAGETVLDAALRAGLDLPFSCKGGMCSTCRAKVTEGDGGDGGELLAGAVGVGGRVRADVPGAADGGAGYCRL